MGNQTSKQNKDRPRKNVHWKSAEPPSSPGKPILVPFELTNSEPDVVTIKWSRPVSDGGATLIGYIVEYHRLGSIDWVKATPHLVPPQLIPELSLSGLEPGWRYQFRIIAENAVGKSDPSEVSDPLTVTLQRNAISAPRFTVELSDAMSVENDKVEFRVNFIGSPQPQVSWFKDGFEIFSSRRTKIITENDYSVLIIHQSSLTDEGEVKCTATNRAGYAVTRAKLTIEAPPKIRLPRQYEDGLIIEADEIIRLKVGIAGRPAPTVAWSHNGETITDGGRFEIINTDKNSSLKILNANRSDRGEYNLKATNKLGEDNSSFLVTITARPTPPGKVIIKMSLGKSVTLSWTPPEDDGGCKIGNYIVEYFRVGWGVWLKASTCRQLTTTLNDLIEGSQYKFRVKAENPYGVSDPSEESDAIFIPDPKRGITKVSKENEINEITEKPMLIPRQKNAPSLQGKDNQNDTNKKTDILNKTIQIKTDRFDNDTLEREMSYGASDKFYKFNEVPANSLMEHSTLEKQVQQLKHAKNAVTFLDDSRDKTDFAKKNTDLNIYDNNENLFAQTNETNRKPGDEETGKVPRDVNNNNLLSLANSNTTKSSNSDAQNIHNSSEFVLVLYPDKESNAEKKDEKFDFDLEDLIPPPPLSQSAPDLSSQEPTGPVLRYAVSSTELLYERAMARFYQAVEYEESVKTGKKGLSVEQEITRRRSFTNEQDVRKLIETERRNSMLRKMSAEIPNLMLNIPQPTTDKENEQKEKTPDKEKTPEKERINITEISPVEKQEKLPEAVKVVEEKANEKIKDENSEDEEEYFSDDYTESTASEEESFNDKAELMKRLSLIDKSDEMDTYSPPRNIEPRMLSPYRHPENDNAVEVLTKPLPLGDPNFVPKPILKRPSSVNEKRDDDTKKIAPDKPERKSLKQPNNDNEATNTPIADPTNEPEKVLDDPKQVSDPEILERKNEVLLAEKTFEKKDEPVPRPTTPIIQIQEEPATNNEKEQEPEIVEEEPKPRKMDLLKKKQLENRQNSIEENKVVVDFYGDIIREVGAKHKKPKIPIYMNPEGLKQLEQQDENNEDEDNPRFKGVIEEKPPALIAKRSSLPCDAKEIKPMERKIPLVKSKTLPENEDQVDKNITIQTTKIPIPTLNKYDLETKTDREKFAPIRSRDSSATRSTNSINSSQQSIIKKTPNRFVKPASQLRNRSASKSPVSHQKQSLNVSESAQSQTTPTPSSTPRSSRATTPIEVQEEIDTKVKSNLTNLTDLSLFLFATYIYLFKHPLLALPILILLIYRQLGEFFKGLLPDFAGNRKS